MGILKKSVKRDQEKHPPKIQFRKDDSAMKRRLYPFLFGLGLLTVMFMIPQQTQAALGENIDSIESNRKVLSAVQGNSSVFSNYTVHEISSNSTTIREYVSQTGIVFGVAWNGLIHPDLTPLLGSYTGEYREMLLQTPRVYGRKYLRVKAQNVIVEKWGHMRNLRARAYIPSLIPARVNIDDIK